MSHLSLMMNGMQQFCDSNGVPFLAGTVNMWIPNTETPKDTWVDKDHLALNSDPIILDAAGRCVIWGTGIYRQVLKDINGNTIWDKLTLSLTSTDEVIEIVEDSISTLYDLPVFLQGLVEADEEYPRFVIARALTLPAGLTASRFAIQALPTALMTFTILKNDVSIGSVSFSTLGVPTVTFASLVSFVAGDIFSVMAPAVADATGASVSMTFVFTA